MLNTYSYPLIKKWSFYTYNHKIYKTSIHTQLISVAEHLMHYEIYKYCSIYYLHSLCYEIYTIILSTSARFMFGTFTSWRWTIHAETCQSNECLHCYMYMILLNGCNKWIYHWNHKKFVASKYRFPHVQESFQKLSIIWACSFKKFCKPFPRPEV
jgi:hypothetical protein